jgi:hypothetical protein
MSNAYEQGLRDGWRAGMTKAAAAFRVGAPKRVVLPTNLMSSGQRVNVGGRPHVDWRDRMGPAIPSSAPRPPAYPGMSTGAKLGWGAGGAGGLGLLGLLGRDAIR